MNALRRALRPAAAELAGNARLRCGVWLIAGIVLFWCILVQSDRVAAVHGEYAAEVGHLATARRLVEQQDWQERLEAEREMRRGLEAALWEAKTEGLAQAKLQGALNEAIEGLRLDKPRIRSGVSQPVPDLPGVWRVQARLDAAYQSGVELKVLHALATHPKRMIVDRLDLRRRGRRDSYLTLILSAYFVGVEAESAQSGGGS